MASNSTMMKTVVIYLAISLFLYVGGIRVIDTPDSIVGDFVNTNGRSYAELNGSVDLSSGLKAVAPNANEETGSLSGGVFNFIDAIRSVRNWINFAVNIVFAVPGLFLGSDFPLIINLLVGIPITVIGFLGLMYFVRSGQ